MTAQHDIRQGWHGHTKGYDTFKSKVTNPISYIDYDFSYLAIWLIIEQAFNRAPYKRERKQTVLIANKIAFLQ